MKLFLDTANLDEIAQINRWGVLDGVTTNPTLAAKEGRDFASMIKDICAEVSGDVSAEVVSTDTSSMLDEAHKLADIADNVVIKLPLIPAGLAACSQLSSEGIRTNVTLCFSPTQAILAAKAGATYVSPFLGRLDDIANDGIALLTEICEIFRVQGYETEVLAASLRSPQHVAQAALAGADIATLPAKVFEQMVKHPLTDIGLERFLADWDAYLQAMG
ncbi:fructose-6-phosphate aldolase [Egicoccus halophilus]|uniref:Probable transaldolase n=1 Tax=Egicoccus halophilus TaxID=1670830 RepID=A0A8J3ESQ9_9ACTN|nr:fructose-6-phosphate aldolase [Egicoccus halophilus]GGI03983.1 transaldolase [Egicoccus halophilus]